MAEEVWPTRQLYPAIEGTDILVGCDVTGDLLVLRGEQIVRLDGETGNIEPIAPTIDAFLSMDIEAASEMLGGELARDLLAGLVLGPDPLRLLPTLPFTIADTSPRAFLDLPLSKTLKAKAELHERLNLPDEGDILNLDFWPR